MRLLLQSGFLLFLLAALQTDAVSEPEESIAAPGYSQVESVDELWRFHVGTSAAGLTLGSDCLCILSNNRKFLAGRDRNIISDKEWCQGEEHWELKKLGGGRFALKRRNLEGYMSCMSNGGVILRPHAEIEEKFLIFINKAGDKISFYSARYKKFVTTQGNGKLRCTSESNSAKEAVFYGWKTGMGSDWTPNEDTRYVKTFDNTKSKRPKEFEFTKTLGVKTNQKARAGVRVDEPIVLTEALAQMFGNDFESPSQTDWQKQDKSIWEEAHKEKGTRKLYRGDKLKLYQVIGIYGPFEIYSNEFLEVHLKNDESAMGGEMAAA